MDNAYNFEASKAGVKNMYCMACEAVSEKRHNKNERVIPCKPF